MFSEQDIAYPAELCMCFLVIQSNLLVKVINKSIIVSQASITDSYHMHFIAPHIITMYEMLEWKSHNFMDACFDESYFFMYIKYQYGYIPNPHCIMIQMQDARGV